MKYIEFGSTGKQVSAVGVGCMRIARSSAEAVDTLVKTALDCGINFFDHADIYGGGRSESLFGEVLTKNPGLREKVFLQSKTAIHDGSFDFSKDYILKSVDGILTRLQTDHLDSLLLHRPDALMEPEEVNAAFEELQKAGKVLHFGVSNQNPSQMALLQSGLSMPLSANQVQLSLAHTPLFDAGFNVDMADGPAIMRDGGTLEYCRLNKMTIQAWSPLQMGYFGGIFLGNEQYAELNKKIDELAAKYGVTPDAIAYAWILRYPGRTQVITGTANPEHLATGAKGADVALTHQEWYDLYRAAGNRLP